MKRLDVLRVFAVVCGIIHLTGLSTFSQVDQMRAVKPQIELRDYLRKIGDRYNRRFTIEVGLQSGDRTKSPLYARFDERIPKDNLDDKSLERTLESLRRTVPFLTYSFNARNKGIIHVIDSRLAKNNNYAMNKIVGNVEFEGYVFDLINNLGKKGLSISAKGAIDLREMNSTDDSAFIQVSASEMIVRDILTNYLQLGERGRVLWIAETELGRDQTTFVRYLNKQF